jgi:hypothetical protein
MKDYRIVCQYVNEDKEVYFIEYRRLWWWKRLTERITQCYGGSTNYERPYVNIGEAEREVHRLMGKHWYYGRRFVVREYSKRYD